MIFSALRNVSKEPNPTFSATVSFTLPPDKCLSGGRSNEVVAEKVGLGSYETFRKAEKIIESAPEEMIRQLDEGQLSINAFTQLIAEGNAMKADFSVPGQGLTLLAVDFPSEYFLKG